MKKLFAVAILASSAIAAPAMAQSFGTGPSDTTTITAEVAAVCTIDAPAGGMVPVTGNTNIGDVRLQCNDPDGFTATVSSAHQGVLKGADSDNASTILYTFTVPGVTDGTSPLSLSSHKSSPARPATRLPSTAFRSRSASRPTAPTVRPSPTPTRMSSPSRSLRTERQGFGGRLALLPGAFRTMMLLAILAPVLAYADVGSLSDNMYGGKTVDITLFYAQIVPVCTVDTLQGEAAVDLSTRADQVIGGITYTCNASGGFTRRVISLNSGSLRRGSQSIAYLISQTGDRGLAIPQTQLTAPRIDDVAAFGALTVGSAGTLSVQIPSLARDLLAGEYRDTVTFEITPH